MRDLVVDLAHALRDEVAPELGSHAAKAHAGSAEGGDVTFAIDERAETRMEEFLADRAPNVAFYSEDRGLVTPASADPEWFLIVDPIDGTRPAAAGLESCCVSIAAARSADEPTMADVEIGCVLEMGPNGQLFIAERGKGLDPAPVLSTTATLDRMFWTYGFRGRPARALTEVLAEIIDASSVGGASFDLGSACFDMTRVVTGQLDAYIEPGPRMIDDVPGMREAFEKVGGGAVLNNSPYDLAAAVLCLEEGGAIVTDAYGQSVADKRLLGSTHEFQISCVASSNRELHTEILKAVDEGIERLRAGW